jgi:long-chain fatty acid transport protein
MRALAVLLCLGSAAQASPLEMFGFGGRSPALAATGVAYADDYECLYLNPAGLADVKRKRLTAGTLVGSFSLDGVDREVDPAVGVEVGAAFPLPLGGALADRIGLGFAIYVPTTVLNRARAPRPGAPFFALLENRSEVVGIQVGLGARISERWSAGAGFLALGGLLGGIDVAPDAAGRFATTSEQQLIAAFAPIFGARFRASDALTLGSTLRFSAKSTYDILITADLGEAIPVTIPPLRIAGTAQYDPMALAVEAAFRAEPFLVTAQVIWQRWGQFPVPTMNVVENMPPMDPAEFHDTVTPRLGLEWRSQHFDATELILRGGYAFVLSPAPEITGSQALLDNHRNVLAAGVGVVSPPIHIDVWGQAHLLVGRAHDRPEGEADLDTGGTILVGGLMIGVDL